jgi:hypothetical protein
MINILLLALVFSLSTVACQPAASKVQDSESSGHQGKAARARAEILCQRLPEMKTMPFKGEPIEDEVYNGLISLKDAAIPCLIGKITDSTRMNDPRQAPVYRDFRVGDAAFFLLLDITKVPFEQMLPAEVKSELEDQGVYAYFEYIKKDENRKSLQASWQAWYDQKQIGR